MGRTTCTEPQCLYKGALYLSLPCFATKEALGFDGNCRCCIPDDCEWYLQFVRVAAKSTYYGCHVRPSVRLYGAAPAGRVPMKYDVGDFGENLSRQPKFG